MTKKNFQPGETVYLISGSPHLLVTAVDGDDVSVSWKNVRDGSTRTWVFESWTLSHDPALHDPVRWANPYAEDKP